jgi:hypothetical protein
MHTPDYAPVQQLTHRQSIGMARFFRLHSVFQRVMLLSSPDGKGRTMTDENRISNAGPNSPANDNEPTGNIQSALPDPAAKARTDALILVLARLLGTADRPRGIRAAAGPDRQRQRQRSRQQGQPEQEE